MKSFPVIDDNFQGTKVFSTKRNLMTFNLPGANLYVKINIYLQQLPGKVIEYYEFCRLLFEKKKS